MKNVEFGFCCHYLVYYTTATSKNTLLKNFGLTLQSNLFSLSSLVLNIPLANPYLSHNADLVTI